MAKFTVYTDKHNEFRWKFVASNNAVVAKSGESYKKEEDCLASLSLLQKDIGGAPVGYQLRKGVHPAAAVRSAASPTVIPAPSVAATPAVTASPAIVASPPVAASPAVSPVQSVAPHN